MFLDYSEVCIGAPEEVMERLAARLGELNLACLNLRIGLTSNPAAEFRLQSQSQPWMVMKLLWVTHSFVQAMVMADLLRAWDGKLFAPQALSPQGGHGRRAASFYAYALVR
ncbi:MAG: hypothetical protein LDL11_06470 [Desulfarculus sp.]|nr:hypothetical protein [Desulfarculus sp.]